MLELERTKIDEWKQFVFESKMTEKNVNSIIADDWYQYMNYLSGGDNVINYSWRKKGISKSEKKKKLKIFFKRLMI